MPTDPADPKGPGRPVVLVLVKGLGIGGAEKLISEGARHWNRAEFDYRVAYLLPWKDQLGPDLESLQVPTVCIGTQQGFRPRSAWLLRRLSRVWNVDLVHAHLPVAGILARLSVSVPIVYTEHNLASSYRTVTRLLNRATYRRNTDVTAVSQAVADSVAGYGGPQVEVIPNGVAVSVDPGAAEMARRELGLDAKDPLVVHVGNIRPGKGHDLLVETVTELLRLVPGLTVVSIGGEKYPGDLARFRSQASHLGDRLRFLGRRPDALSFIAAADVYVNPADFEGLPVTILEAMALGRPVVATAVGGVPDVVVEGETGRLVQARSPRELAKAIHEVLTSPDRGRSLGRAGADVVADRYGLAAMVNRFESVYRRLLT